MKSCATPSGGDASPRPDESNVRRNFVRLLGFTKKYKMRLAVGIFTGLLSAGSFFGLLSFMPNAFAAFKMSDDAAAKSAQIATVADGATGQQAGVVADGTGKPAPAVDQSTSATADMKMPKWYRKAEKLATAHGIPLSKPDGTITWQALCLLVSILPFIVFARIATSFLNSYCMRWVGAAVIRDIRNDVFRTLQKQSLCYYGNMDVGQLISRCVNDTASVEHVIASTVAEACRAPFEIIAAVAFAVAYAVGNGLGRYILVGGIMLPLCVVPVLALGTRVRRWTKKSLERISVLVSRMHENFTGIRVVKAFNTEKWENDRFAEVNSNYFRAVVKSLKAEMLMSPLMEAVTAVIGTFFIICCFVFHITLAQIMIIGIAIYSAYRPLKQLANINASVQKASAAMGRIFAILDTDTSLPEAASPKRISGFSDKISFNGVGFHFSSEGPEVVKDANFAVKRGTVVALVGGTGSGKSTLANLLARFYDPTSGSVTLDGVDLRDIATPDLRKLIGVVTQDTILFNDTIANNISYGTEGATRDQIEAAARMANAHDFIVAHPDGYDRICGEKGFLLSGGEKQRIALARAILKNPPILILDEATSALDTVTERLVQDAISKVMANRTTLAIAHRLSTVRDADLILVVDKGVIVERGTHQELYEKGGAYRRLCDMQLTGE